MTVDMRLRILLVTMVTAILVTLGAWSLITLRQASNLATTQSEEALIDAGQNAIHEAAQATARQIEQYLRLHPEVNLSDEASLSTNRQLREIAVQPVGDTGYTTTFDEKGISHFDINPALTGVDLSSMADELPDFWAILRASLDGSPSDGYYDWKDAQDQTRRKYMSVVPVGDTPLRVAATTFIDEFTRPVVETRSQLLKVQNRVRNQLIVALVSVGLLVAYGSSYLVKQFTRPIRRVAAAATRAAAGELQTIELDDRRDEIGILAKAFNNLTLQLDNLATRFEERTQQLSQRATQLEESNRQSERRAAQLEASAQVARAAASMLDPTELFARVVHLISDHFGHYHTGIFLLDETGHWAVLEAANSKGGQRMLARGHRLAVGTKGIVGFVAHTGRPYIARNVAADAIYFDNPDLPYTRTEIALPLIARGQIIGALDIQSTETGAFDEADVSVFSTLADQIAVAIDNARLYDASQVALAQVRAIQRQFTLEAWTRFSSQSEAGFFITQQPTPDADAEKAVTSTINGALQTGKTTVATGEEDRAASLIAPIKVRGQVIGALGVQEFHAGDGRSWSDQDIALIETIADQVGQAMEAARLYEEAQQRARREQLVTEITSRIRSAPDLDGVMRTAVREIRRALGAKQGIIRVGTETHLRPSKDSPPPSEDHALDPTVVADISKRSIEAKRVPRRASGASVSDDNDD